MGKDVRRDRDLAAYREVFLEPVSSPGKHLKKARAPMLSLNPSHTHMPPTPGKGGWLFQEALLREQCAQC